jgi:5-methylcytosine-specific restriction protein A
VTVEPPARRNPDWTRDETVLVCAVVAEGGWRWISATDPHVTELSQLLQRMPIHPPEERADDFRNPNGVARKTADVATHHPDYTGKPTKGSRVVREVIAALLEDPLGMALVAPAVRSAATDRTSASKVPDLDFDASAGEGRLLEQRHLRRERDRRLRIKKIAATVNAALPIACQACDFDFDFEKSYGSRGAGFIEVHHRLPLHASGPIRTHLDDLVLCSNCHRMIHRAQPWLTFEQVSAQVGTDTR